MSSSSSQSGRGGAGKRPATDAGPSEGSSSSASGSRREDSVQNKRPRPNESGIHNGGKDEKSASGSTGQPPARGPKPVTSVYVSNLPLDATQDELASAFSRYGVLLEDDLGSAANRIKLYRDAATGMFTGDALITYFKAESVDLAVSVLDESCLRAHLGQREPVMRVRRAEFGRDKDKEKDKDKDVGAGASGPSQKSATISKSVASGSPAPSGSKATEMAGQVTAQHGSSNGGSSSQTEPKDSGRRQLTDTEKRKVQKRMAKLQSKVDGWESDSDEEGPGPGIINSTTTSTGAPGQIPLLSGDLSAMDPALESSRTVVLTKMFTLAELDDDPTLLLDLKAEVREECETLGRVTSVVLYDKEPEGVMSVKFANVMGARACVAKMNNRYFAGRTITAFLSHGKPRYRRTGVRTGDEDDDDEAVTGEARRIDAFGAWLEGGGDDNGQEAQGS
ncbi:hypothetical protein CF326_g2847 [Tilletia indica]|nr:hypothetical protein CF326_g2847 [Tilletia indica]